MADPLDPVDGPDDVISFGPRRLLPGSRSRKIAIAVAVVVAAGVVIGLLVTRGGGHHVAQPPPSSNVVHIPSFSGSARPSPTERTTLSAPPPSWPTGVQALVSTEDQASWAWYSVDSHQRVPIQLPPIKNVYFPTDFAGGAVFQIDIDQPAPCGACSAQQGTPVYYVAEGSGTATSLGTAQDVVVSADHRSSWLIRQSGSRTVARKVDLAGRPLGQPIVLPDGYRLAGGWQSREEPVGNRLLLTSEDQKSFALWTPGGPAPKVTRGHVLGVSPHEMAWVADTCSSTVCPVHIVELTSGRVRQFDPPRGRSVVMVRFSPDHRYAAVVLGPVSSDVTAVQVAVRDEKTGRFAIVPGTRLDVAPQLTWTADGHWLAMRSDVSQLGLVDPSQARLYVARLPR